MTPTAHHISVSNCTNNIIGRITNKYLNRMAVITLGDKTKFSWRMYERLVKWLFKKTILRLLAETVTFLNT